MKAKVPQTHESLNGYSPCIGRFDIFHLTTVLFLKNLFTYLFTYLAGLGLSCGM